MEFQIEKSEKNNQYYFRIVADNGKTLAHSETYHNLSDCEHAVDLIRNDARYSKVVKKFDVKKYVSLFFGDIQK